MKTILLMCLATVAACGPDLAHTATPDAGPAPLPLPAASASIAAGSAPSVATPVPVVRVDARCFAAECASPEHMPNHAAYIQVR